MKKFLSVFVLCSLIIGFPAAVSADTRVSGHFRSNGRYVPPHYRSDPDGIRDNNWSHSGNQNPYNGRRGSRRY